MKIEVLRVFAENFGVYGVRKVWAAVVVTRLAPLPPHRRAADARALACRAQIRGKPARTTISGDKAVPCPLESRQPAVPCSKAPRPLGSDFTYVATWTGFVYARLRHRRVRHARRIVGWRVSTG